MKCSFITKLAIGLMVAVLCCQRVPGQSVQHLAVPHLGGMPGWPTLGGITRLTNGVQINWSGPSGYYQVFQASNNVHGTWLPLGGATNLAGTAVITKLYSNAFFRVAGPAPSYAGSQVCRTCHASVCSVETNTPHAVAFTDPLFKAAGGQTNAACLVCHTVGYGLPTGFVSLSATPNLAGVQCEDCHGPAANHAANEANPALFPRVEIAATLCGGCHHAGPGSTTFTNPATYEEWSGSAHGSVTPGALQAMAGAATNLETCGACHSGSVRVGMLNGANPLTTLTNDYQLALGCVTCHDPHQTNAHPVQLSRPLFSTNAFHLTAANLATLGTFTNAYNASSNINLCAQCHNDRGAAWTDTANAPHDSIQYNFLIGNVGVLASGPATYNPGSHAGLPGSASFSVSGHFYLTNQCTACHLPGTGVNGSPNHALTTTNSLCLNCHDGDAARSFLSEDLNINVSYLIYLLNLWSATKAPATLTSNGLVAWEYTTPGGLTWTNVGGYPSSWRLGGNVTFKGPNAAGQALLTTNYPNILRARFNLYVVLKDGSMGVHNPAFAIDLIDQAQEWVSMELNK